MKGKIKLKNNSGITLIALVVTIIIMLILAGISLRFVWGEGGIIEKTERARIEHVRGEEKDILSLSHSALYIDNKAFGDAYETDKMHDEIQKHGKDTVVNWKAPGKIMRVRYKDTKNVYTIDVETGEIKFEGEYNEAIEQPELKISDLEFIHNPSYWTNGNTKVTIQKNPESDINLDELTIEYSIDSLDNWTAYTEPIEMSTNGTICVRLVYELIGEVSGYITNDETNIDKLDPTGSLETENTTNSIMVKVTVEDATQTDEFGCSGIKGYYYSKDDGTSYTELTEDSNYTFNGLTQGIEYKIKVKVEDNAGNIIELSKDVTTGTVTELTEANTRVSMNPSTSTNGNVTVTIATDVTGYTLQYKTEKTGKTGEVSDWTNYTGSITLERNEKVYARAVDSTNQTGNAIDYAVVNIVNIDKLSPKALTLTQGTVTTSSITVSASTTDADATADYIETGIAGYRFSSDNGSTWTDYQTSGEYTFTDLVGDVSGVTYHIKVEAKDNVGNTTVQSKDIATIRDDDYYIATANTLLGTVGGRGYYKTNSEPAIIAFAHIDNGDVHLPPIMISTSATAVQYYCDGNSGPFTSGGSINYKGVTFYYSSAGWWMRDYYDFSSSYLSIGSLENRYSWTGAVEELLMRYFGGTGQKNYEVCYNANGGSGAPDRQTKIKGQTLTLSSTVPTKANSVFLGWSTSPNATSATYAKGANYTVDGSVTLYAIWHTHTGSASTGGGCYGTPNYTTCGTYEARYKCSGCGAISSSSGEHYQDTISGYKCSKCGRTSNSFSDSHYTTCGLTRVQTICGELGKWQWTDNVYSRTEDVKCPTCGSVKSVLLNDNAWIPMCEKCGYGGWTWAFREKSLPNGFKCDSCGASLTGVQLPSHINYSATCPRSVYKCPNGHRAAGPGTCASSVPCSGTMEPQYTYCGSYDFYDYKCNNCQATSSSSGTHKYISYYSKNCGY